VRLHRSLVAQLQADLQELPRHREELRRSVTAHVLATV
jgi:hypothetical protein